MDHGFPKAEHLCLQRDIDALFATAAHSAVAFPVRAVWREVEWAGHGPRVKVLVSVSKRKFKHAVDRNRAKRQMREAYRLNKHLLAAVHDVPAPPCALHIGFIWVSDEPQKSSLVHKRLANLLRRINDALLKTAVQHSDGQSVLPNTEPQHHENNSAASAPADDTAANNNP